MVIGIKFCGGCNPVYNRIEIVNKILENYPSIIIEYVKEDKLYEIALIINGCSRVCTNHEYIKSINKVFLQCENDYKKVEEIIDLYQKREV